MADIVLKGISVPKEGEKARLVLITAEGTIWFPETLETEKRITDIFPDWKTIEPGNWSQAPLIIRYDPNRKPIEIGLYREPTNNEEYAGKYTLQIFHGDDVVFCQTVKEQGETTLGELIKDAETVIDGRQT